MGEDSNVATSSDAQEQYGQCKTRKQHKVFRGSNISPYSMGVYRQESTGGTTSTGRQPVPFAVESVWFAFPRGVAD